MFFSVFDVFGPYRVNTEHLEQPRMFLLFFAEGVARVGIQGLCAK